LLEAAKAVICEAKPGAIRALSFVATISDIPKFLHGKPRLIPVNESALFSADSILRYHDVAIGGST